jgi:chemotaxis signal transduction protein
MVSAAAADAAAAMARQVAELRHAFDQRFALAPPTGEAARLSLLHIQVGDQPYVLPLAGLVAFTACGRIAPLPGQHPACLGLAGHRGRAIPVYGLGLLLGRAAGDGPPRWLAVTARGPGIAVATFSGQIQARPDELRGRDGAPGQVFAREGLVCPLIDLATLLAPFIDRPQAGPSPKE